ncbi:MAG: response regulator transcription factor [Acidobacteria bacterium]|nr:response regulator transcription factor [Acidobacteriota bacterium]
MPISLVLADSHPIVIEGLRQLFLREDHFAVLAACADGEQALAAVETHHPDVLVMDLQLPRRDGVAVLREIARAHPATRVVLLTAVMDEDQLLEAVRLGVSGIILKEMPTHLLVKCIQKVHAGGQWLELNAVFRALDRAIKREEGTREITAALTPRELEVVRLVVKGAKNKEIAETLFISDGTIKIHLHNVYEKLGVKGRVELILFAQKRGLV